MHIGTITLQTINRTSHIFDIYTLNHALPNVGGIYVWTHAKQNWTNQYLHDLLYVGQTGNFRDRLTTSHHAWNCVKQRGVNRICLLPVNNLANRSRIEKGLIKKHQPSCNDNLKSW